MLSFMKFTAILFFIPIILTAQWERLNNAPNFPIRDMVRIDDKIYVATASDGIYLSSDRGDNWQPMNEGISLLTTSIVSFGNILLVGTLDSGIFRSKDLGAHWNLSSDSLLERNVIDLKVDGNNIYALTESSGIWISQDGGITWVKLLSPDEELTISALEVKNNFIFAGTLDGAIFFSSNNGESWVDIRNGQINGSIFYILFDNGELFVGTDFGMYYSSNMGVDWSNRSSGIKVPRINYITKVNDKLLIGSKGSGVFFSNNNGEFWFDFNDGLPDLNTNIIICDNFYLYAGTEYGSVSRRRLTDISIPEVYPPTLRNPSNLFPNADTSIVFLWDEIKAAKGYHFILAKNESFTPESIVRDQLNLTKNNISISELEPLTLYFWKVAAVDLDGVEHWSEIFTFRTRKSLTIPTLIAPLEGDNFNDFPIIFIWTSLDSAISHTLQLSKSSLFETIDYEFSVPDTIYSLNSANLTENSKYYWRIITRIRNLDNETISTSNTRFFYYKQIQSVEHLTSVGVKLNLYQEGDLLMISLTPLDYCTLNFEVVNIFGTIVLKGEIIYSPTETDLALNIAQISCGLYFVNFDFGDLNIVKPIFIVK